MFMAPSSTYVLSLTFEFIVTNFVKNTKIFQKKKKNSVRLQNHPQVKKRRQRTKCAVIGCVLIIVLVMLIDTYRSMMRFASPVTRGFFSPLLSLPSQSSGSIKYGLEFRWLRWNSPIWAEITTKRIQKNSGAFYAMCFSLHKFRSLFYTTMHDTMKTLMAPCCSGFSV